MLIPSFLSLVSPGPTAPLHWVRECIDELLSGASEYKNKLLVGINFYGYDFGPSGMEGIVLFCTIIFIIVYLQLL